MSEFKIFSEIYPDIKNKIQTVLAIRGWDEISQAEKHKMFVQFQFDQGILYQACKVFNTRYARKTPFPSAFTCNPTNLSDRYWENVLNFFYTEKKWLIYEFLSIYLKFIIEHLHTTYDQKDYIIKNFNNILEQFAVEIHVTEKGLILRDEQFIMEHTYEPVFRFLSADEKWQDINTNFDECFDYFIKESYSACISKCYSTLEYFMQIKMNVEIGKKKLNDLLKEYKKSLPDSSFSRAFFNDAESYLMQSRQKFSISHATSKEPTKNEALLYFNTVMIFIRHCIEDDTTHSQT